MSDTITVTGKEGPGITETAIVYSNVTDLDFNIQSQVLSISYGYPNVKRAEVDLNSITTITYSISSHVATVTVST